jgi:hypothetical protein
MTNAPLVPLYGFVRGDTLGLLVLVHADDTVATLVASLVEAASVRVRPAERARIYAAGRELDPKSTILDAGLAPLDRVDLLPEGG